MNNTQYTDAQIDSLLRRAESMKAACMDYWPHKIAFLPNYYCLYCMEDDAIWLVDTLDSVSMRDAVKIQKILG